LHRDALHRINVERVPWRFHAALEFDRHPTRPQLLVKGGSRHAPRDRLDGHFEIVALVMVMVVMVMMMVVVQVLTLAVSTEWRLEAEFPEMGFTSSPVFRNREIVAMEESIELCSVDVGTLAMAMVAIGFESPALVLQFRIMRRNLRLKLL